jgi:hypothetical protein
MPIMMANAMMGGGRLPLEGAVPVGYGSGLYTLAGEWPTPARTNSYGGSSSAGLVEAPEPKTPTAGQRLWPNLP